MNITKQHAAALALGLFVFGVGVSAAFAGDSLSGKVTEVRNAEVVILDYGSGHYTVHIIGIEAAELSRAAQAKEFISKLVLGKRARMRFVSRAPNGEMMSRLLTDEPDTPIKDVGLELVRAGLARRKAGDETQFGYKYAELTTAENEARRARRGLWSESQPK